ncbi:MAG: hypothetical protein ACE5FN_11795 [Leptospirillia bacterium]
MRYSAFVCLAAAALLAVSACTRMVPVSDPLYTVASDRYGTTQEVGALRVTVRIVSWRDDPLYRLEPYVTPLYLQVKNQGPHPVPFSLSDAVLVDGDGTLYRPLPPQRLEGMLTGAKGAVAPQDAVLDPSLYRYDTDLAATLGALTDGPIEPGTQIQGALYFQRVTDWTDDITLRLTLEGETRAFHFRVR